LQLKNSFFGLFDSIDSIRKVGWVMKQTTCVHLFRLCFGLLMFYDAVGMIVRDEMRSFFVFQNGGNFSYTLVSHRLLPIDSVWRIHNESVLVCFPYALALFSSLFAFGFLINWTLPAWTLFHLYVFLLERSRYLNHHYLFALISFLLWLLHAELAACGVRRKRSFRFNVALLWLLKFQICVVYFYAGVCKLSKDNLLGAKPIADFLARAFFDDKIDAVPFPLAIGAAWLSALFDLCAPFALLFGADAVRLMTALGGALFHGANHVLFDTIGSFPFVMVAANVLFFVERRERRPAKAARDRHARAKRRRRRLVIGAFVVCFALAQAALPLRAYVVPLMRGRALDDAAWTQRGELFSWRLMAARQQAFFEAHLSIDGRRVRTVAPQSANDIVVFQRHTIEAIAKDVDMMAQYCAIEAAFVDNGGGAVQCHVDAFKSVNGRPYSRWVNGSADLLDDDVVLRGDYDRLVLPTIDALDRPRVRAQLSEAIESRASASGGGWHHGDTFALRANERFSDSVRTQKGGQNGGHWQQFGIAVASGQLSTAHNRRQAITRRDPIVPMPFSTTFTVHCRSSSSCIFIYLFR
jgi:vitamin K-dependent gamma-carboxylase